MAPTHRTDYEQTRLWSGLAWRGPTRRKILEDLGDQGKPRSKFAAVAENDFYLSLLPLSAVNILTA